MNEYKFLNENFLLQNPVAETLYHQYAKGLPIIDYHNHLPPDEVASNHTFKNITEVWLKGDHYKWRAMRANGVAEKYITGDASDKEKFLKWAETVPYTICNPLYHWTHLEMQRYFGISEILSPSTADQIYAKSSHLLQQQDYTAKGLLKRLNVEVICTTDHPTDSLVHHQNNLKAQDDLQMRPTFRPDKFLVINHPEFQVYLAKLEQIIDLEITQFDDLLIALRSRIDHFHSLGCRVSDHGLNQLFDISRHHVDLDEVLLKSKSSKPISLEESESFQMRLLYELAKMYHSLDWTMQIHLGAIRNNNSRLMQSIGADVGADSIGDYKQAEGLSYLLNQLDSEHALAKTILYNLNPSDNEVFVSMAGNYNDGNMPGKIQWGSAWWFLDQKDGMEKQINALSNMGLLTRFIGMLTDSRSFLSFPRHEYFRRILCNLLGNSVVNGELPHDEKWLGQVVQNISYYNAKDYFNFGQDKISI